VAVVAGLVVGKLVGIVSFSGLAVRLKIARLPEGVDGQCLLAGGLLGGIGFTMALFIASLALEPDQLPEAKVGVLVGSAVSAMAGMLVLAMRPRA
jgi:NhaA family Na+:H+ antiporter